MNLDKYFILRNIKGIIKKYNLIDTKNQFDEDEIMSDLTNKKIDYYVQVYCYLQRSYLELLNTLVESEKYLMKIKDK